MLSIINNPTLMRLCYSRSYFVSCIVFLSFSVFDSHLFCFDVCDRRQSRRSRSLAMSVVSRQVYVRRVRAQGDERTTRHRAAGRCGRSGSIGTGTTRSDGGEWNDARRADNIRWRRWRIATSRNIDRRHTNINIIGVIIIICSVSFVVIISSSRCIDRAWQGRQVGIESRI